jgi:maltooligosyltrehalose synthase
MLLGGDEIGRTQGGNNNAYCTPWTAPVPRYEEGVRAFVEYILEDWAFVGDLEGFVAPLIEPGRITSLAQTVLTLTVPGVPDLYQGTELWELSLVDPDNRRPIDYDRCRRLLAELEGATPEAIWARIDDGLPKLWVTRQALHFSGDHHPCPMAKTDAQVALKKSCCRMAHVALAIHGKSGERA